MFNSINSHIRKKLLALILSLSTLVLLLALTALLIFNYSNKLEADEKYHVSLNYYNLEEEIRDFKNENISLLKGFSAFIQTKDSYDDDEIYTYLHHLLKDNMDDIRNVGILKDTTITWVYPLEGNESAIGVDLANVANQGESVLRVKENLETLFTGPVDLVQGGVGFIVRLPIVKDNEYWGMASIVLKAENAFDFIKDISNKNDTEYLITHSENINEIIFGDLGVIEKSPLKFTTAYSIGAWDVYTVPMKGWNNYTKIFIFIFILFALVYIYIARSLYKWIVNYNLVLNDKIELEKKYILDRFTGIYTREYFNIRAYEEFSHAGRYEYPISMIYFDLDHFKNVNDKYGHSTGDKVLLSVVELVKETIRTEDVFSRWGGDEFIILLRETSLEEAIHISERIRAGIENLPICRDMGVTTSLGCSQWVKDEYLESWFLRTDKALYESKNSGRNRVSISESHKEEDVLVKLKWDNSFKCGNPIIDDEHSNIIDVCNNIIENSLSKNSFDETIRNVELLIKEIEGHFNDEIEILKELNYPNVNEHIKIHENLLKDLGIFYKKVLNQDIESVEIFAYLLNTVIDGHFKDEDIKYFKYI